MPDCRNLTNRIITAEGGQQYYPNYPDAAVLRLLPVVLGILFAILTTK
jgi:hypothetical protein